MKTKFDMLCTKLVATLLRNYGPARTKVIIDIGFVLLTGFWLAAVWFTGIVFGSSYAIITGTIGIVGGIMAALLERKKRITPEYVVDNNVSVPKIAKYMLCFFLTKKIRDPLLGDLEEDYRKMHEEFGEKWANIWFYKQAFTSLWPIFAKWGLLGWLEEFIRRIAH